MFVDDASEVVLWSERGAEEGLEDRLPISESLRARIKSWLDEYTLSILGKPRWSPVENVDHDRRGLALCAELQEELGSGFEIQYLFHTVQARRELAD